MPPSHHSHSSHSSHSHSHSHSSHSSHSHSSHSSYSSGRSRSYSPRPVRTRTNQPTGWSTAKHGNCIRYDFRDHDYIYYPHSWTDENGNVFREFNNFLIINVSNKQNLTVVFVCSLHFLNEFGTCTFLPLFQWCLCQKH